ncbi:MAG TPA: hypothetical protein VGM90_41185 [Kofleriaceae bacterium]|jgi:hypothetical protein
MVLRGIALGSVLLCASTAGAAPCPPSVHLDGEATLVASVGKALLDRGISLTPDSCPAVAAHVAQRDQMIVVQLTDDERVVRGPETAATVIESFARSDDVGSPLLAIQTVPHSSFDEPSLTARAVEPGALPRGLHAFAGLETSYASDNSTWLGFQIGVCKMVGPICLAGRLRSGASNDGAMGITRRNASELLVGIDVPFQIHGWLLSPGFGAGPSHTITELDNGSQFSTNNLRADAHATLSIPLTARFAVDVTFAANLLQQISVDERRGDTGMVLPSEPWGFLRLGVALRYGHR